MPTGGSMLRRHQGDMVDICQEIKAGAPIADINCDICPGSGKTGMALVAFNELVGEVVDFCIVVVPRANLRDQFESDCLDSNFFSGMVLRAAENEPDLLRGCNGYITTYQALSANIELHLKEARGKNFMIICDELHHLIDEAAWGERIYELIKLAKIRVQMTGTFETNNGFIKTIPYKDGLPDKTNTENIRWINYTREQALNDGVILPIQFSFFDSSGAYISGGKQTDFDNIGSDRNALRATLETGGAKKILRECANHWLRYRGEIDRSAQLLTIDATIKQAQSTLMFLREMGIDAEIATSDDDQCHKTIKRFEQGQIKALCTVGTAYEGMNVPPVTHEALLTHIRTKSWINQAIARVQRCFGGKEKGYVFAPADSLIQDIVNDIQKEIIHEYGERKEPKKPGRPTPEWMKRKVNPIYSEIVGRFDVNDRITVSQYEKMLRKELDSKIKSYLEMQSMVLIDGENEKTNAMTAARRNVIYNTIKMQINNGRDAKGKFIRKHVEEMNIFELQKAIKITDELIR
jgi:superfamily II DNA or RNA helicase